MLVFSLPVFLGKTLSGKQLFSKINIVRETIDKKMKNTDGASYVYTVK